jgi:hypothetical protein
MNLLDYRKSFHQINDKFKELCEFKCDEELDGVPPDESDDEELSDVAWYGVALYISDSFAP